MLTLKIGDIVWPKNDSDPYKWLVIDFRGYETPEGHRANIQLKDKEWSQIRRIKMKMGLTWRGVLIDWYKKSK